MNLYGPRDNFDLDSSHVIPALIRKCLEAKARKFSSITVWGTGDPTREFLYVGDAADGILLASEHYNDSAPVNLGSGEEISIKSLVRKISNLTGFEGDINWDSSKPDGQPRRLLDTKKAKELFSFESKISLRKGLDLTIKWYKSEKNYKS